MSQDLIAALSGVGGLCAGALINFVINISVKQGKLETRVDTVERDLNNLGEIYRKQITNRRAS